MKRDGASPRALYAIAPPLLLVAIVFAWWQPSWSAGVGLGDFPGHVALLETLARQLEEGPWFPLWTSDWNSGSSLLFWYIQPLFSSYLLLPFVSWFGPLAGIRIGGTFFLALAALAMYGCGRSLSRSSTAGFIAALFYVTHPSVASFVGEAGQIHQPIAMAILPLLFWSWIRFGRVPDLASGTAACVSAALLFYDMERFWLTAPWAFIAYLVIAWQRLGDEPPLARAGKVLAPAAAAAAGMTALVAFPTLPAWFERPLLQWHDLSTLEVFRDYYSFPHLLALFDRAGGLAEVVRSGPQVRFTALPGQWYQGVVVLGFVAVGCVLASSRSTDHRLALRPGLVATFILVALVLAFGVHAVVPKHAALAAQLSGSSLDAGAAMMLLVAGLLTIASLGALAYAATPSLRSRDGRLRGASVAIGAAAIAVLLFATPFVWLSESVFVYEHLRAPTHFAFPSLPLLLAIAAALVTPSFVESIGSKRATAFIATAVLLHMVDVAPYREVPARSVGSEKVETWERAFASLRDRPAGRLLDTHHYSPTTDMFAALSAQQDMAWGWLSWTSTREIGDLIKTGFFDSMRIARQSEAKRQTHVRAAASFAGLAGVRYVAQLKGISPGMPESDLFEPIFEDPVITLYENALALPLVQFYDALGRVDGETAETVPLAARLARRGIASIRSDDIPEDRSLDIRRIEEAMARARRTNEEIEAPCRTSRPRTDHIILDCDFEAPGYVVFAEAWFPDWWIHEAGRERPALRLNHAFLGAAVEAGPRRIEFRHRPRALTRFAMGLSSIAWGVAIVLGVRASAIALRLPSRQSRESETAGP